MEWGTVIGLLIFGYVLWQTTLKPKPASAWWSDEMCERFARQYGWVSEVEYNGERKGVRHAVTGDWSENWRAACDRTGEKFGKRSS